MLTDDVLQDSAHAKPIGSTRSQVILLEHTYRYLTGDTQLEGRS